jgi:hypothetical protein
MIDSERELWPAWAAGLRRWGLHGLAAGLVEAAGPLNLLLAQALYIGQPYLRASGSGNGISALARLLDDPRKAARFAAYLREEEKQ